MGNKSRSKFSKKSGKKSGKTASKSTKIPKELKKLGVTKIVSDYKPVWKPRQESNIKTPAKPKITVKKGKGNKGKSRVIFNTLTGQTYKPKDYGRKWSSKRFDWEEIRYV